MTGRPDTWMPWYIGDYMADTMHLTTYQHGAYLLMIAAYWRRGGPLPDDERFLKQVVRHTGNVPWAVTMSALRPFFVCAQGALRHKRIDLELLKARIAYEKLSLGAQKTNRSRHAQRHTTTTTLTEEKKEPPINISPPLSEPPITPKQKGLSNGKRRPQEGQFDVALIEPDDEDRAYAAGLGLSPERVRDDIRAWAANVSPRSKAFKRNPRLFWQGWCRRNADQHGRPPGLNGSGPAPGHGRRPDSIMDAAARVIARRKGNADLL
jgi:uncharacterized protein YdaU (DUF1376 family)